MIAWINLVVLIMATLLILIFYLMSVRPAALERKMGAKAYARCTAYRVLEGVFMTLAGANYVIYFFYPLPIGLTRAFPWPWWMSALMAGLIALPSGYLFFRGMRDAGEETMMVKKEHRLYEGIYQKIRHPQAVGELPFWWVFAFLLHSPFLALYSLIWVPIFAAFCWAEEKDLVLRYGEAYEQYRQRTGAFFPKRN